MAKQQNQQAEQLLKERIKQILAKVPLAPDVAQQVEEQIFVLFAEYASASEEEKEELYKAGEARILGSSARP